MVMKMDVGYKNSDGSFSLRSAALIIKDNKLLVAKNDNYDCFYTLGGGVNPNEASTEAVIRECREETGYDFEIDRLAFIQERFYISENCHHHEVVFFYLMKNIDVDIENGTATDQQCEHLYWLPVDGLEKANLVPAFLKTALKSIPKETLHIVSYE